MIVSMLFWNPLHIPSSAALWLVIPLCASVAIAYKAIRVREIRRLPRDAGILMLYMLGGLTGLGLGLWALLRFWPK